ncbi:MAG: MgtC/SapB family protein [Candidatus Omnitrophica bacterium]|nr:MgtC/SapB family protein [Candidatus Omnitrophota bacterium]
MFQFTQNDFDITLRLIAATFLGGLIGFEREWQRKEAGVRTYAMVSLGSALIMVVSIEVFEIYRAVATVDPSRIAAQVVSGIGFLGAGAIIRDPREIKGLTTAAGIWTVAGIGLACGLGQYKPAVLSTFLALVILILFSKIDRLFGGHDA